MKYYKISENELKRLISVLTLSEDTIDVIEFLKLDFNVSRSKLETRWNYKHEDNPIYHEFQFERMNDE